MTQSVGKIATKSSEPGLIEQIDIFSNKTGKSVSLTNGLISFTYVESIMNDTIKVNLSFIDSGNTIDNKNISLLQNFYFQILSFNNLLCLKELEISEANFLNRETFDLLLNNCTNLR